MPSAFISYRRQTSAMLAQLLARELQVRGVKPYVDTRQTDGGGPFPDRLLRAIEANDVFVCLVAESTLDSEWVQREIAHAHAAGKIMIPVFQESYVPLDRAPDEHYHVHALLQSDGVHIMDVRNVYVDEAINDLAAMIKQSVGRRMVRLRALPRVRRPVPGLGSRAWRWIAGGGALALIVIAVVLLASSGVFGGDDNGGEDEPRTGTNDGWTPQTGTVNGVRFVEVPGECFVMGSAAIEDAVPEHQVCLDDFWIAQTPVTNAQYRVCVEDEGCAPPFDDTFYANPAYDDLPVLYVTWDNAQQYAVWLGGSLPTEAQWEYAARGPDGWPYPWGEDAPSCDRAVYEGCAGGVAPVGPDQRPAGASWVGALDLAGNVWEWVADWYGPYSDTDQDNPTGPATGDTRAIRGGAFDSLADAMRAAVRGGLPSDTASGHLGFRIVIDAVE